MGRPKSKGAYVPLAAQYYLDDAILEAGPLAELMWVRVLSFLASVGTDGFITDRQIRMVGMGLRDWRQRVQTLQDVGLLTQVEGGFEARSWLKWNRTTEEQHRHQAKDRERKARSKSTLDDRSDAVGVQLENVRRQIDRRTDAERDIDAAEYRDSLPQDSGEVAPNSARKTNAFRADSVLQSSTEQSSAVHNSPYGESSSDADASDVSDFSDEVKRLSYLLAELVKGNGHPVGVVGVTWWRSCERLLRIDGYTLEQVEWMIRWATSDEFWSANIRSMPKMREKFSTMVAQSKRKARTSTVEHGRGVDEILRSREVGHLKAVSS